MPLVSPDGCEVFVSKPMPEGPLGELTSRFRVAVGHPERPTTADELALACRSARAVVAMLTDRIDAAFLGRATNLKIVSNFAVGVNNIDLEACRARGLWVTNTPDVLTDATADLTMALLLACARRLPQTEAELRANRWQGWAPLHGWALPYGKLAIIGLGRIGKAVAKRAQAFGIEVRHSSPDAKSGDAMGVQGMPLDELLAWADVVSVHCPLTAETQHLLDRTRLATMRPGAILLNTSRGPVVDEEAVAEALESGRLGAVGLDVFEREPVVHPRLLAAPNALLLPHVGSATEQARTAMASLAAGAVVDVLEGRGPKHPVVKPG
ncbi:MAG: D-glycerate dehydrogenase [Deltaproteobacteria bacterium]|nr:D-glycerate dehydrogenase [Deltaproteobacteria bacterium]